jgi:superfamily II DNA or RNA helicase
MYKLRDYQQEAIDKVRETFERGISRQLIKVFTGGGKSLIAVGIHKSIMPGKRTLFLVDQIELGEQMVKHFRTNFPDLNVGLEMGDYDADDKVDILVASVQTLGHVKSNRFKKFAERGFDKIVADEAHKSTSPIWQRVLHAFGVGNENFVKGKLLVGMTATPNRTDAVGLSVNFDDISCNFDIRYGISNGWLTDIQALYVESGTNIDNVSKSGDDFNKKELSQTLNTPERNALILKSYKELVGGEQGIIYCASVDHAYALTDLFNNAGYPSACIEGMTDKSDRRDWIDDYRSGKIVNLFNYGTLTTGFDAPETKFLMLARPIRSPLLFEQIVGRGLRPNAESMVDSWENADERIAAIGLSSKSECKVIDICDTVTKHRLASVASLFGLSPKARTAKKRFFKDVVMAVEEVKHEHGIEVENIVDIDNINVYVKKRKMKIGSLDRPDEIKSHSNNGWLMVGSNAYEVVYPDDKKSLLVEKNELDQWELYEYDQIQKNVKKLQTFNNLSGAVKIADEYASRTYTKTKVFNHNAGWSGAGVTSKQYSFIMRLTKGRNIKVDAYNYYPDTNVAHMFYGGELLDRGKAALLINRITGK